MKKVISIVCVALMLLAMAVSVSASGVRTPGPFVMELKETMYDEEWKSFVAEYTVTFDECYGVVEYPNWGMIPVVKEGSRAHVEFTGDVKPTNFYSLYPMREEKNYYGNNEFVYYNPQTGETVDSVREMHMNYQFSGDMINLYGSWASVDDVVNGIAFGNDGENKYWYRMYNGFKDYKYHCIEGYTVLDQTSLFYAIAINDEQINQYKNTGVMNFTHPLSSEMEGLDWSSSFDNTNMRAILFEGVEYVDPHTPSQWAENDVNAAHAEGITSGIYDYYREIYYKHNITRRDFTNMVIKSLEAAIGLNTQELASSSQINFYDVYSEPEIYAAAEIGIVTGRENNCFAPEENITRQEIAVMLCRALKYVESVTGESIVSGINSDISSFADSHLVADWAKNEVGTLVSLGIMNGVSESELSPLTNTSVQQAIVLVMRMFNTITL